MSGIGALAPSELLLVQPSYGITLATVPGQWFLKMARACLAETGQQLYCYQYGGYRSAALQNAMHTNPHAYGVAAGVSVLPHPEGTHELGTCIDILASGNTKTIVGKWLRTGGAARFGFHPDTIPGDVNHYKFVATSIAGGNTSPLDNTTTNGPAFGDTDMRNIRNNVTQEITTVGEFGSRVVTPNAWPAVQATWGTYVDLGPDDYNGQIAYANDRRAAFIASLPVVSGGTPTAPDLTPVLDAIAALKVPTADENGAAARTAIVK